MKLDGACFMTGIIVAVALNTWAAEIPGNLAPNPSFEQPENGADQPPAVWEVFSSKMRKVALTDKVAATGRQSLKMSPQGTPKQFLGIAYSLPVTEGEKYTFEAKYIADKDDGPTGTMDLRLVIEWKRGDGSEITRTTSALIKAYQFSRLRWETVSLKKVTVPKDAVKAVFGIHVNDNERGGSGTVYVDDVVILKHH